MRDTYFWKTKEWYTSAADLSWGSQSFTVTYMGRPGLGSLWKSIPNANFICSKLGQFRNTSSHLFKWPDETLTFKTTFMNPRTRNNEVIVFLHFIISKPVPLLPGFLLTGLFPGIYLLQKETLMSWEALIPDLLNVGDSNFYIYIFSWTRKKIIQTYSRS